MSQNTDRWAGKGSGGRRCPLGGASHRGGQRGHIGHGGRIGWHRGGHIGHLGGLGELGSGGLVGAEPKELKDTLLP